MTVTLAQLLSPGSPQTWQALLLQALAGLGIASHNGLAQGGVTLGGNPLLTLSVVLQVFASGEPGAATFKYSLDGGATFSAAQAMPAAGLAFALPTTGVNVFFTAAPVGAGTSFVAGETYSFQISTVSLPVSSWQPGSAFPTLVSLDAQALAELDGVIGQIAAGGFVPTAGNPPGVSGTSPWLTLAAKQVYFLDRFLASSTQGVAQISDASHAGPFAVVPGTVWFADASTGRRFVNLTGGTLALNGTLQLVWQAEQAGAAWNIANLSPLTIVAGVMPGVTVTNPVFANGTWVTSQGTDDEADPALALRCQNRWPSLSTGATRAVYLLWATSAEAAAAHAVTVTRATADPDVAIPGQVNVFLASTGGPAGAGAVADVLAYMNARIDLLTSVNVAPAAGLPYTANWTVTVKAAFLAAAQAAVAANVAAYINSIPIAGTLYEAGVIEQIMTPAGVIDAQPPAPFDSIVAASNQVFTNGVTFTWVTV